jgi:hypothetical protein
MDPALGAFGLAFLALIVSTLLQRRERAASRTLAVEQRAALVQLAEEVTSLREALVSSGAVERTAKPPPPSAGRITAPCGASRAPGARARRGALPPSRG